jgi:purine-binding chemotaxis protein CheW
LYPTKATRSAAAQQLQRKREDTLSDAINNSREWNKGENIFMQSLPAKQTEKNLQPKGGDSLIQLVSFMLSSEEYGVEVLKVREIIRMPDITKMPNTPHFVEGIINLRGKVIPIISMRKRFGLPETDHNAHTRIMIMDVAGGLTGFIVDAVSEVIRIPASDIQPPPIMISGNIDQDFIEGVFNHADRLLIIMDIDKMFASEELEFATS